MAIIKELLFNDGEGLDYADLNNSQRFMRAQLWDHVVRNMGRTQDGFWGGLGLNSAPNGGFPYLNTFGHHCAPMASGTSLRVDPRAGVLMQSIGTPDGSDPTVLAYSATAAELQTLHTAGDATNPRYDLVSIQLTHANGDTESRDFEDATTRAKTTTTPNKRRNVVLTKTLTVGTPLGSPVIPAVPAGHVPLYSVYVPATHNTVHDDANIRDFRYPLGSYSVDVHAADMYARNAYSATWGTITGSPWGHKNSATVGATMSFAPSMHKPVHSRLVGVSVLGSETGNSTYEIRRFVATPTTSTTLLWDVSGTAGLAQALRNNVTPNWGWTYFNLLTAATALPIWGGGWSCPEGNIAEDTAGVLSKVGLLYTIGNSGDAIAMVRFHFLGGL